MSVKEIHKSEISEYWGYSVKESKLVSLINEWKGNIIITSRKGKIASREQLSKYVKSKEETLLVFGSQEKGVHEILGGKMKNVQNAEIIEFFPGSSNRNCQIRRSTFRNISNN